MLAGFARLTHLGELIRLIVFCVKEFDGVVIFGTVDRVDEVDRVDRVDTVDRVVQVDRVDRVGRFDTVERVDKIFTLHS